MANNGNLTPWFAGQSGNLNGRPVGSRTAYSRGFFSDLADVWAKHGKETMIKTAQDNPAVFFATCARLIGPEVKLTIEQSLPGNLSMEDWQVMREIVETVRQALPDAADRRPGAVPGPSRLPWFKYTKAKSPPRVGSSAHEQPYTRRL
jgi:hypothetical protein